MILINKVLGFAGNGIKSLDKEILGELKEIRKRSGISIHNNLAIESTAYYQNAIKN
jgi:hypothetical protein